MNYPIYEEVDLEKFSGIQMLYEAITSLSTGASQIVQSDSSDDHGQIRFQQDVQGVRICDGTTYIVRRSNLHVDQW